MKRLGRIVISGDGMLLVADDQLPLASPVEQAISVDDPLRAAALDVLAGRDTADGIAVHQVRAPDGATIAVELLTADCELRPLSLGAWAYPSDLGQLEWGPELGTVRATLESDNLVGDRSSGLLLPAVPDFLSGLKELFHEGRAMRNLRIVQRDTGDIRTIRLYGWLPDADAEASPMGVLIDVTDLSGAPDPATRFFEAVISAVPDTFMVVDVVAGELLWSNSNLAERLGYPVGSIGNYEDFRRSMHWADRQTIEDIVRALRTEPTSDTSEVRFRVRDATGRWRWLHAWISPWMSGPDGRVEQVVTAIRDVDEAVRTEQRLLWEAGHDPLTGLANRRVITDTLQQCSDGHHPNRRYLYFIDLDDFKKVNDALGHSAGDDLLRTIGARITAVVSGDDVVGRFGGDELVILSAMEPERLAPRILNAVRRPTLMEGAELAVSASVGVATIVAGEKPGDVLHRANEAMYTAKRSGRDRYEIAGPLDTGPAQRRVELEAGLRRAMSTAEDEFSLAFQPIVTRDGRPVGAEALLRWFHPTRGELLPSQFLSIAESAGLMNELGELIIRKAFAAAAGWAHAGQPLLVSVNVGGQQLGTGRLEALISDLLVDTGVPPHLLCLEVTESVLVDADSPELAELIRLRELGLEIALDDFGTGYAPLTYLKRLPATMLKLDQTFVAGLGLAVPNPIDVAVARAVFQIANEVGLRVVAEGVESEREVEALAEIGYEYFQGYWAHAPMPTAELAKLLAGH